MRFEGACRGVRVVSRAWGLRRELGGGLVLLGLEWCGVGTRLESEGVVRGSELRLTRAGFGETSGVDRFRSESRAVVATCCRAIAGVTKGSRRRVHPGSGETQLSMRFEGACRGVRVVSRAWGLRRELGGGRVLLGLEWCGVGTRLES
ncbi:hypothetical protein Drorol1_Dr00027254 [Drosera rotundifolia]